MRTAIDLTGNRQRPGQFPQLRPGSKEALYRQVIAEFSRDPNRLQDKGPRWWWNKPPEEVARIHAEAQDYFNKNKGLFPNAKQIEQAFARRTPKTKPEPPATPPNPSQAFLPTEPSDSNTASAGARPGQPVWVPFKPEPKPKPDPNPRPMPYMPIIEKPGGGSKPPPSRPPGKPIPWHLAQQLTPEEQRQLVNSPFYRPDIAGISGNAPMSQADREFFYGKNSVNPMPAKGTPRDQPGKGPSAAQINNSPLAPQTKKGSPESQMTMEELNTRANKGDRRAWLERAKRTPADNFTGKSVYALTTPDESWALEKAAASGDERAKKEISLRLRTKDETGNDTLNMSRPALDWLHGKTDSPAIREAAEFAKSGANKSNKLKPNEFVGKIIGQPMPPLNKQATINNKNPSINPVTPNGTPLPRNANYSAENGLLYSDFGGQIGGLSGLVAASKDIHGNPVPAQKFGTPAGAKGSAPSGGGKPSAQNPSQFIKKNGKTIYIGPKGSGPDKGQPKTGMR